MSESVSLPGEFRISTWFVWSLNQLVRLLPVKQLAISLTVVGEEAAQELLSAYACGIRHFPGSILDQVELYQAKLPDIVLIAARLREADMCEADLSGADLVDANLTGVNLETAVLDDVRW